MSKRSNLLGRLSLNPLSIALGYALVGSIWIIFSDRILALLGADLSVAHLTRLQTSKGVLYIFLSAGFIYVLTRIATYQVRSSRSELQNIRSRYFQLFEQTAAILLVIDQDTSSIIDANPAAERFYGWAKHELIGRPLSAIEVPAAATESPTHPLSHAEQPFTDRRHRLASGEVRDVAINATPISAEGQRHLFLLIHDVTEPRRLEQQLRQAQKMDAVGRLTGGIAHDLNNVLTVVLAGADLIAAELPASDSDVRDDLDDLRSAARRGASMIRKLLSFSRTANLQIATLDLGELLDSMMPTLGRLLPESIVLNARPLFTGGVRADRGALEQVVLNLATNARDAMPQGGSFTLETGAETLNPTAEHPWVRPGTYAYLRATDTGGGMDERTRSRMFEPFFTTKGGTEGAGLGMAMVYGLVKQHDGFVLVDSKPGQGTTVTIYLPLAPRLDRQVSEPVEAVASDPGGRAAAGKTILLVEDEDALRRAGQRILERLGYVVLCADDGQRGLEILEEKGETIDLVITDLVMPKIGGRALYEAARMRRRDVRFLFTSGYAPAEAGGGAASPGVPFIQKPWTFEELEQKVREVFSKPPSP